MKFGVWNFGIDDEKYDDIYIINNNTKKKESEKLFILYFTINMMMSKRQLVTGISICFELLKKK